MELPFITLDVFAERPFGGNPLAVVLDGRGLDTAAMQAIAGEFNLSETVFMLPPEDPANSAALRIFTPQVELPFAGHPNVGAAVAFALGCGPFGRKGVERVRFEERVGPVALDLDYDGTHPRGAWLTAPAAPAIGDPLPPALVARAAGLPVTAIRREPRPPRLVRLGPDFAMVELADAGAMAAARPVGEAFGASPGPGGEDRLQALLVLYRYEGTRLHVRVFAPLAGIAEDPATGAANLALAGYLAALAPEADLDLDLAVSQGGEMGRPSRLRVQAAKRQGGCAPPRIHGCAVQVMEGRLRLPG